jgi:soluble lytic murein transglycosylase
MSEAKTPLLRDYVTWRMLLADEAEIDADELITLQKRHANWPSQAALIAQIEKALFRQSPAQSVISSWLASHTPQTSYGWMLKAKYAADDSAKTTALKQAFALCGFQKADQEMVMERYGYLIDDAMRESCIESLLQRERATQAEILLPVEGAKNRLYATRIAVIRDDANLDGKVSALPSSLRSDAGLMADRIRWRHKRDLRAGATELLLQMPVNTPHSTSVWPIRNLYAREAMERGDYKLAEKLLANAGTTLTGGDLAEANWMRGWLALSFLNKPGEAYQHFQNLFNNVGYPVSLARGAYWSARAAEAMGNSAAAQQWYSKAATYPTVFYGQLAYAKVNPGKPLRFPSPEGSNSGSYDSDDRFQLALILMDSGLPREASPFVSALADEAQKQQRLPALMASFKAKHRLYAQVLTAKYGIRSNNILVSDGWPRVNPQGLPVELSLLHGISRQESEFNPHAVSHADARGLMQLLPSTARKVAAQLNLPYSEAKLFDPSYNMQLGSVYLGDLIAKFDGNYILAIAGYNAGPGRSVQWVERFGRPGRDISKTLTFMELIPFSETRNYVQRVLENVQVYRALFGPDVPLAIEADLLR